MSRTLYPEQRDRALGITGLGASPEEQLSFQQSDYRIGGVSEKMLAQTLRVLEEDGFVLRTVHATKPPKVEYSLTSFESENAEKVQNLISLIEQNVSHVMSQRESGRSKARNRER